MTYPDSAIVKHDSTAIAEIPEIHAFWTLENREIKKYKGFRINVDIYNEKDKRGGESERSKVMALGDLR